jgi:hypothetical protein
MNAAVRAEQLTAHIANVGRRGRVQSNLTKFLSSLDSIRDFDEEEAQESTESYQDDGTDGITVTSYGDLEQRERDKLADLKLLHEEKTKGSGTATATAPDINTRGKYGYTALHRAVVDANLAEVETLLAKRARVDVRDASGMTALDKARSRAKDSPTSAKIAKLIAAA